MLEHAAKVVRDAEVFVIIAGAGMGVDSGLPDFRGDQWFWKAYPAYSRLGLSFVDCANPQHFADAPPLAGAFTGTAQSGRTTRRSGLMRPPCVPVLRFPAAPKLYR